MKLSKKDRDSEIYRERYTCAWKAHWDNYSELKSARDVGRAEGLAEARAEEIAKYEKGVAKRLLQETSLTIEQIAEATNLPCAIIKKMRAKLDLNK